MFGALSSPDPQTRSSTVEVILCGGGTGRRALASVGVGSLGGLQMQTSLQAQSESTRGSPLAEHNPDAHPRGALSQRVSPRCSPLPVRPRAS
jgi:hypothetical protein